MGQINLKIERAANAIADDSQSTEGSGRLGRQRWVLFAAFALIVIFRLPGTWTHGRFLDEEATVFLAYAWHYPWSEALFRPFIGYWNAPASGTTVLAAQLIRADLLSLERAPYLTMGVALAFQMLPAVLILTGKAAWLSIRPAVIAALLLIASTPATEEVFYNVLHIQFHLALCVALILALDPPRKRIARLGYGALLFFAPLAGPGAIVLLPLFALRSLLDRDPERLRQMAFLGAGAAVQLLLFFGSSPTRGHFLEPPALAAAMFVRLIVLPILGVDFAGYLGVDVRLFHENGNPLLWLFATAAALLFSALLLFAVQRRDSAIWLLLSGLTIAVVTLGAGMVGVNSSGAFHIYAGERYHFIPNVMIGLTLVVIATREGRQRLVWAAICAWLLFVGAYQYPRPNPTFATGPSWAAEVQAWRIDHRHPLVAWPRPWAADLSDEARTCSPPSRQSAKSEPRYCESGWMAPYYEALP